MADNYLLFSEVLPNLTASEEAWLKEQLQKVCVFGDATYAEDAVPADLAEREPDWSGILFLRDKGDYDPACDSLGFEYHFADDPPPPDGWGRHLWFYSEDYGNPENVAWLIRKFLKQCHPDQWWWLAYAENCSKPHVGEFGGGAIFVTADEIKWQSTHDFIEQELKAFRAKQQRALAKKKQ
jgi:hypothetical protein